MKEKTFCDPIYPCSEETGQRVLRFYEQLAKERNMEEKKTKKMTKAEAFEWLKGKKVLCYSSKMEMVQGFVKSLGFHWSDYSEEPMLVSILFLGEDGKLTYSVSLKRFEEHESPEISADDILSIEIVEGEDNIAEKNAFQQARDIMKWLREEQSPHTLMIIDGYHVELLDGVKAEVWKE